MAVKVVEGLGEGRDSTSRSEENRCQFVLAEIR